MLPRAVSDADAELYKKTLAAYGPEGVQFLTDENQYHMQKKLFEAAEAARAQGLTSQEFAVDSDAEGKLIPESLRVVEPKDGP